MYEPFELSRLYNKIRTDSQTRNCIDKGNISFPVGNSDSKSRKNKKVSFCSDQAKDFLHLLGIIASCLELIPKVRLYMRPIQLHLIAFWSPASMDLEVSFLLHNIWNLISSGG